MRGPRVIVAAGALLLVSGAPDAAPAAAQVTSGDGWLSVSPGLVGDEEHTTVGLRIGVELDRRELAVDRNFPYRLHTAVEADVPLTWESDRNPETLRAEARFGILMALFRGPPTGPGGEPSLEEPDRWGFVEASLAGGLEGHQTLDDADLALGVELAYEHDQDRLWYLPAAEISFSAVECVGCELVAGTDSWSRRLDVRGRWSVPVGAVLPGALEPLRLRPAGRYFKGWGLDDGLELLRGEEGRWGAVELAYEIRNVSWLYEVHVGWRGGDVPTPTPEDEAWTAGATLIL